MVLKYTSCLNTITSGTKKDCNVSQMVLVASLLRFRSPQTELEFKLWEGAKLASLRIHRWPYEVSQEFLQRTAETRSIQADAKVDRSSYARKEQKR